MKFGPFEGKSFFGRSMPTALQNALEYAGRDGHVASLPELIQARIEADFRDEIWTNWYIANSEENVGRTAQGTPVVLTIHGGGILGTPQRVQRSLDEGLINGAAKYTPLEFSQALDGRMPDNSEIPIYSLSDFRKLQGIPQRYGVVMGLKYAQTFPSGAFKLEDFLTNDIAEVRCGRKEAQEAYAKKVSSRYSEIGCWHSFKNANAQEPHGRVLFLGNYGLVGDGSLNGDARLVGVRASETSTGASEGRDAQKFSTGNNGPFEASYANLLSDINGAAAALNATTADRLEEILRIYRNSLQ